MNSLTQPRSGGTTSTRGPVLAVASLVCGILGLVGSVAVVGGMIALVGLVLGALHLRKRVDARGLGWTGVWLSVVGMAASVGFAVFYAVALPQMMAGLQRGASVGFAQWEGKPAPDLEVARLDGSRLKLSDLKGRRVVLDFWATWCGPCVKEIPHFARLQREVGEEALVIVGLSREDRAVLKKFVEKNDVPYAVASVADLDLPEPYAGVQAIPTTFFLDEAGVIQRVAVGYHDFDALKEYAMGSGPAVPPPTP